MPELVKLYKNLRDFQLNNMLYKTKEGLQKEAFDCCDCFFWMVNTNVSLLSIIQIQTIILLFVVGITANIALENNK